MSFLCISRATSIAFYLQTPELDVLQAVSSAIRCEDYNAVELYLSKGGNPDGFYGMTLLGQNLHRFFMFT